MNNIKNIIFPLGFSLIVLIISSLVFYSLFIIAGTFLIIYGLLVSVELVILGSTLIVVFAVVFILFDIWLIYQCRIEFKDKNLIVHNFAVRGTVRFPKSIVLLNNLKTIEKIEDKTLNFIYSGNEQNKVEFKTFSKKQISKIISQSIKIASRV